MGEATSVGGLAHVPQTRHLVNRVKAESKLCCELLRFRGSTFPVNDLALVGFAKAKVLRAVDLTILVQMNCGIYAPLA